MTRLLRYSTALGAAAWAFTAFSQSAPPRVHFRYQAIPFRLESSESPRRYAPETMAGGLAVFDYNNDGNLDIFFTNGADINTLKKSDPKYSNRLFEGDGKGGFRDVTGKSGLAGSGFDNSAAVGDYDNDGWKDLFVGGVHGNRLYRNQGGVFIDATAKAPGLDAPDPKYGPLWSVGGAWLDVNNDGWLDLFVVNYLAWSHKLEPRCEVGPDELDYCHPKFYGPTPNRLFLNNGDGTFRDVSEAWGLSALPGKGMGAGVADYDLDGRLDVFITNDKAHNFLLHNTGSKFEEVAFESGVALTENGQFISGMGVDFRDLDDDGYPDIAFVALENESFPIFRNAGKRGFEDATERSGVTRLAMQMAGYSPNLADFDNDGRKDLFSSRGHVQGVQKATKVPLGQPNTVFRNLGRLRFEALTEEAGFGAVSPSRHRGSAAADFDHDGRLDIVVCAISAPAEIWMNDTPGGAHWIAFDLEGVKSDRDAIGARVKVTAGGAVQYNHVSFSAGYASSNASPLHFGLGTAKAADLVEIRWPSGAVQELRNVAADRVVKVKEPPAPADSPPAAPPARSSPASPAPGR